MRKINSYQETTSCMKINSNVTVQDIFNNIQYYIDLFLEQGILIFKELNPTRQEEWDLMKAFGDHIGWFPNSSVTGEPRSPYLSIEDEDHETTFRRYAEPLSDDEIFIDWHIEHVERDNYQTGALWHMRKFDCSPNSGQTGFINMIDFFDKIPEEWQKFLQVCKVSSLSQADELGVMREVEFSESLRERSVVVSHYTNQKLIYRPSLYPTEVLRSANGLTPSSEEYSLFKEIEEWTIDQTINSPSNQTWFKWNVGDTMIVDLSVMAHAVKGGFNLGERYFSRIWAHRFSMDMI
jgi:alpha-ketoglutarate-dependent taurine dioxygenase